MLEAGLASDSAMIQSLGFGSMKDSRFASESADPRVSNRSGHGRPGDCFFMTVAGFYSDNNDGIDNNDDDDDAYSTITTITK